MSNGPVTCQVRYTLDLSQLAAFETYARAWMILINRYGGVHHGYFIPRTSPDVKGASFPGLGYDGPEDVALALFTFPSEKSYQDYREAVATDPHLSERRNASPGTNACSSDPSQPERLEAVTNLRL